MFTYKHYFWGVGRRKETVCSHIPQSFQVDLTCLLLLATLGSKRGVGGIRSKMKNKGTTDGFMFWLLVLGILLWCSLKDEKFSRKK